MLGGLRETNECLPSHVSGDVDAEIALASCHDILRRSIVNRMKFHDKKNGEASPLYLGVLSSCATTTVFDREALYVLGKTGQRNRL